MYERFDKSEETRHVSHQQSEKILSEEKDNVAEVQRLASKNMAEKMAYMEENFEEVRKFTRRKMYNMEERVLDMAREMKRRTCCMKA